MLTNQFQLMEAAEKYKDSNAGVRILLASINEAKNSAIQSKNMLTMLMNRTEQQLFNPAWHISYDQSEIVANAHRLSQSMHRASCALVDLACLLETLGEHVEY